jgi:ubiquinone biosynthesis UbiH/UbiF/VisC/COQ6 family hydroxylase
VRAYALNQRSRDLLEAVRCWPAEEFATPVTGMQVHGDEGGHISFSAASQGTSALNWIVDVPVLENLLADALRFQPLIEVFDAPQAAALTVVCEGRASSTRAEFGAEFDVTPYGQWALAARVHCALPHGQIARQWFSQGEILAFLPLGGAGGSECAVVWSASPARAQALEAMAPEAFNEALQTASHNELGNVALSSARAAWPLQQAQALRWSGRNTQGAWLLAGDAAHNVHPLAGQGLNLGLGDVEELVRILDGRPYWRGVGDLKLLRQYERARKADLALVGQTGDALQRLFNHTDPTVRALRNWGMNGFERSGAIKEWVARRAMGATPATEMALNKPASQIP